MAIRQTCPSLIPAAAKTDVGGALYLGGETNINRCSFASNMASSSGLAVASIGSVQISDSVFDDNVFFCEE